MSDGFTYGIYEIELIGPSAALERFGPATATVVGHPWDEPWAIEGRAAEELCTRHRVDYDELPEACVPFEFAPPAATTNEWVNPDGTQTYFVTVFEATRCYGGPEEGGWWYDAGEPILHYACRSYEEAQELRTRLSSEEFPRTGKRNSVLGGEDYDIGIDLEPGTAFPETVPHYE